MYVAIDDCTTVYNVIVFKCELETGSLYTMSWLSHYYINLCVAYLTDDPRSASSIETR